MKPTYRPEIDGLRAIAVVAVIFYHSQITFFGQQPFKGGFIGVDIFFVISGYLITSIILKELLSTGSFSFSYFYERRIRRILPALFLVMIFTFPLAWISMLSISFVDYSKSIIFSLGFSSNFFFHYSGQQYGAESSLFKPFLHTWSLSVEEQYYILFPILILFLFKHLKRYLIHILIVGFIISLLLADWGSRNYTSFNFYILPTRAWELLAGSILAYFEINLGHRSKNKVLNFMLPIFGMFLIGHSILFFNDKMFHPSYYTLSPILGVCFIIWFSSPNELIAKILSTKLFVGIGLISYSLYLWHYPIFAFARINEFTRGSIVNKLIICTIILIVSILSYYFVERPARNKKNKFKIIMRFILIGIVFLFVLNLSVIINEGYKNRFSTYFQGQLSELKSIELLENITNKKIYNKNVTLKSDQNKSNIFLLGDSHAGTLSYQLWKNYNKKYNINYSLISGCQFILNTRRVDKKTFKTINNCNSELHEKRLKLINETNNSIVILFGRLPRILNEEKFNNYEYDFKEAEMDHFIQNDKNTLITKIERQEYIKINYKKTIQKLLSNNHNIILVYPMPEVGISVREILKNNFLYGTYSDLFYNKKLFTTSFEIYKERTKSSFELLDSIEGDNIYRIYPHKLLCNTVIKNRCITHDDKNIFYRDDNHPSLKGAEMINDLIMKEIQKIELKFN